MPFSEYSNYDAMGLAELVRRKELSAAELVEEAISRVERWNPQLNAVVLPLYERARNMSRGPLPQGIFTGVPFLIKDLGASMEGVPTSQGNKLLKNIPAKLTTELVNRWERSGVITFGKTNTPEFGLTPYTESEALGPARNPWDISRTTGGSSGGAAAAVAARMVPMASGGDGGGSIRIPSSACGVFGLKPTRGRTPSGPIVGELWNGFAIDHVITRSVRDSAAMLDATKGHDVGAPYMIPDAGPFLDEVGRQPGKLRIAYSTKPFLGKNVHPDCVRGLEATVSLLRGLGHALVEDSFAIDREEYALHYVTIICGQLRADMEAAAASAGKKVVFEDFDISTFAAGLFGTTLRASDYARAIRYLQSASRNIGRFFENYHVLLTPVMSQPPVNIGALKPSSAEVAQIKIIARTRAAWVLRALGLIKVLVAQTFEFIPWTPIFNVTGQPAMSVPLHWNDAGLPIGMHFVGRWGDEATLFRLAGQLEQAQPWFNRAPAGY